MRRGLLVLTMCACTTAGPPLDTAGRPPTIFTGSGGTMMGDAPLSTTGTIAAPTGLVWNATKEVYAELGVRLTVENMAAHQLGNADFYKRGEIGGRPMAQLVSCGSGIDGPKAASYRIYMSLLTTVNSDGKGGSTIQTTLVATGADIVAGTSSDRIPCGSLGVLEAMVIEKVKTRIGKT